MARSREQGATVQGASPLARYIQQQREEHGWTYEDLVVNANARNVRASSEVFRKAAKDAHVAPLRTGTVQQLAAGLRTTEKHIRELDAQRWNPQNDAPVASGIAPELAAALASLEPSEVQRVIDFARGIQAGR